MWHDLRYAGRLIQRNKAFALVAILVLSLGIGVNTALFSIVNALFFRTLPVERPEELVYLYQVNASGQIYASLGPSDQDVFRVRGADLLDFTSHWRVGGAISVDDETQGVSGEWVEHNYFDLLGVKPILGRGLGPEEDDPATTERAIVISYDLWTRRFKADPGAVGRRVRLNDHYATIVGVMGKGFTGLSDPWTPSQYWGGLQMYENYGVRRRYSDGPIGRMKPGVTFQQVRAFVEAQTVAIRQIHLDRLAADAGQITPANLERFRGYARSLRFPVYRAVDVDMPFDPETRVVPTNVLAAVTTVVGLVLIIATANITGLLLARGIGRTGELAVRRALGAGGRRLMRQLLTESMLLSACGGLLGLVVSVNLVTLFQKYSPSRFAIDVSLDWRVLIFAAITCLGAGVMVGMAPAIQAAKVNVLEALGQGIVGARRVRARLRHGIVIPQIALSLVLLLVAGVHVRALMKIELTDLGYRTDNAAVLNVTRWEPRMTFEQERRLTADERRRHNEEEAAKYRTFNRAILARVGAIQQIASFALSDSLPLQSSRREMQPVLAQDERPGGDSLTATALKSVVSDGYFDAMGMTMRQGRTFDGRDGLYGVKVAVISAGLARRLWPVGEAIGRSLAFPPAGAAKTEWLQVIGVVNDVEPVLHDVGDRPQVYVSLLQQWRGYAPYLVVRSRDAIGDEVIQAAKRAAAGADAFSDVWRIQSMAQIVGEILYPRRIAAAILAVAGLIGLALACIGLYGVVSYSVVQRLREIGIRATLGAAPADIVRLLLREGAVVTIAGTVLGLVLSVTALRLTAGLIPGVPLGDALTFIGAPLALGAVVLLACYVPARRAASIDPISVLRGL